VKEKLKNTLEAVDVDKMKLYKCEADAAHTDKAYRGDKLVLEITGSDYDNPLYVDYPETLTAAQEAEAKVEALVQLAIGAWVRPTPCPLEYFREPPLFWPSTECPCPGVLPLPEAMDADGRTTTIGIGNAFGTGKTEVAVQSAEKTLSHDPSLNVAYLCFGNGYATSSLQKTIKDSSVSFLDLSHSKYAGVWILAAKAATRFKENQVQGNVVLFTAIIDAYLEHPSWPLPPYHSLVDNKLIVIVDEVQTLSFGQLEGLVTLIFTRAVTRMTLLVGAFSPSFVFESGKRVRDCNFAPVSPADMKAIFKRVIPDAELVHNGVSLPGLFGMLVRPLAGWKGITKDRLMQNGDPIAVCQDQYMSIAQNRRTPFRLVRAAIADVPIQRGVLQKAFLEHSLSLGSAFVVPVVPSLASLSLPPLHIASGNFEFEPGMDTVTTSQITKVLESFCSPTWSQFEALTGIAPAWRVAALSRGEMGYRLGEKSILQHVFGCGFSNDEAKMMLKNTVRDELELRWISGGTKIRDLNLSKWRSDKHVVTITMASDHDAEFDDFAIVPLANGGTLIACKDSKFSEDGGNLNFTTDVFTKVTNCLKLRGANMFPEGWLVLTVVASNRDMTGVEQAKVNGCSTVPLIVIVRRGLSGFLSSSLVPPKYREK